MSSAAAVSSTPVGDKVNFSVVKGVIRPTTTATAIHALFAY
jgi:hypothetical protein